MSRHDDAWAQHDDALVFGQYATIVGPVAHSERAELLLLLTRQPTHPLFLRNVLGVFTRNFFSFSTAFVWGGGTWKERARVEKRRKADGQTAANRRRKGGGGHNSA